jgi:hypothetical protein
MKPVKNFVFAVLLVSTLRSQVHFCRRTWTPLVTLTSPPPPLHGL